MIPESEYRVKGGSSNSPCNKCTRTDKAYCSHYKNCEFYVQWIEKCWEDFNRYAKHEAAEQGGE